MKIHLGKTLGEPVGVSMDRDKEYFPTFHIDESDKAGLGKVPDSGKATIKFKVVDRHTHERDDGDKKAKGVSLTIEIHSFELETRKEKPKGNEDAREAFREWAKDNEDG